MSKVETGAAESTKAASRGGGGAVAGRACWGVAVCSFLSFVLAFALNGYAAEEGGAEIAATVDGVNITATDVNRELQRILPTSSFHGRLSEDQIDKLKKQALDERIRKELLVGAAVKAGMKADSDEVDRRIAAQEKRYKGKGGLEAALKREAMTREEYRSWVEREVLADQFLKAEVTDRASVEDAELKAYFEENREKFLRPEALRVQEILIAVDPAAEPEARKAAREQAESLLVRIRGGEDFGAIAYRYSNDRWAVKEGDFGLVHRGQLYPSLEDAAFSMEEGELSDVVETIYGYHLLFVKEKFPPTQMSFEEVREGLRSDLKKKRREELENNLMERLRGQARIVILGNGGKEG